MKNFILTLVIYDIDLLLKLINKTLKEVLIHFDINKIMKHYSNQFDLSFTSILYKYIKKYINHKNNRKIKFVNNKYFIDGIISYPSFFKNKLISFEINKKFKVDFIDNILYMINNCNVSLINISLHLQRTYHQNNYLITIKCVPHYLKKKAINYEIIYNTLNSNPLLTSIYSDSPIDNQIKYINKINKRNYYGSLIIYNFYCWYLIYINSKKYIKK